MCGLAYAHSFKGKPVNNDILQIFDNQRSRGTEGFGLYDGDKMHMVHATKEDKILKWLVKYDSSLIMFHHRWPTSTTNVKRAAHPFSTKDYFGDDQYILVHNGVVNNDEELYVEHNAKGIKYHSLLNDLTFNDSEALLWDFALAMQEGRNKLEAYGSIAFICLKLHKGKLDKLYFARNYMSPLQLFRNKDGIALASEGANEDIEPNTLYTWHYGSKRLTTKELTIPSYKPYIPRNWDNSLDDDYDDYLTEGDIGWFKQTQQRLLGTSACSDNQIKPKVKSNIFESEDDILEEMETYQPLVGEVESIALDYLRATDGHFEQAYYMMEADYIQLESEAEYLSEYKYLRRLELAQKHLSDDPEYVDENSVSSLWASINTPKEKHEQTAIPN